MWKKMVILLLLGLCLAEVPALEQQQQLNLAAGSLSCTVRYAAGYRDWADYILAFTKKHLQAAETYLAHPLPWQKNIYIDGRDEVWLDGVRVGGYNLGVEVAVEYLISPRGNPALIFHELGHFWFGSGPLDWLLEGIVSFLPLAMQAAGFLELSPMETAAIYTHWGFRYREYATDLPLAEDFRGSEQGQRSFFYMKTFKLQYILFRELGEANYHQFLRAYLANINTWQVDDALASLEKLKKMDWRSFLSGWVFPGKYRGVPYTDFSDPDRDFLLSVEEHYLGTEPDLVDTDGDGIPDSTEVAYNLNPLKREKAAVVRELIRTAGPFIDGMAADWADLPAVYSQDSREDQAGGPVNMLRMACGLRNGFFFLLVETEQPPLAGVNVMFDVLVDSNLDNQADEEFAFSMEDPFNSWKYLYATGEHQQVEGLQGTYNDHIELAFPAVQLPAGRFRILPIVRQWVKQINLDEWDSWVTLDQAVLAAVEKYQLQTNLQSDDADGDGIPDGVELYRQLNPVRADSKAVLRKYAPFTDGSPGEWAALAAVSSKDRRQDAQTAGLDMVQLSYLIKDSLLHIMVETRGSPAVMPEVMFDVLVDSDLDNSYDFDFACMLDRPDLPWQYVVVRQAVEHPPGLISAGGEVLEITIPLAAIGTEEFQFLPIVRNTTENMNYDEWDSWVGIKVH